MTKDQMAQHMEKMFEEIRALREAGQKEYAHKDENAFTNFEKLSSELELPREKVLWVYLKKHSDGVISYLKGHRSQRESVHGRIRDMIVYLCLLDGMIQENENPTQIVAPVGLNIEPPFPGKIVRVP